MAVAGPASDVITRKILGWLLASRDAAAPRDPASGDYLLSYPRPFRWVVNAMLLLFTALLALGVAGTWDDPKGLLITTSIFGLLAAASIYARHDVRRVTLSFSRAGLSRETPRSRLQLSWCEIKEIRFSEISHWLVFRADRGTIRVSIYRNGLGTLAELAGPELARGPAAGTAHLLREKAFPG